MQYLFQNRWIALVWALSMLGSIALFVSEGGGSDKVEESAAQIRAQNDAADMPVKSSSSRLRADGTVDDGFASDDEVSLTEEEREAKAAAAAAAGKPAATKPVALNPDEEAPAL